MTSLILGWSQNSVSAHTAMDGKTLSFDDVTSKISTDNMLKHGNPVMSQNNNFAELGRIRPLAEALTCGK